VRRKELGHKSWLILGSRDFTLTNPNYKATYLKRKSKTPTSQQPSSQQREQILKNISRSSREEEKDEDEDIEFEDVSSIIDYWANKEPGSNEERTNLNLSVKKTLKAAENLAQLQFSHNTTKN
jgi:hypothetical protein